jgi:hypothetical protein
MHTRNTKRSTGWRAAGLLALAVALAGCDHGLADLNINPNDPVDVGAQYLFTNAVEASVSRVVGAGLNMDLTGLWVQHYVEHEYTVEDRYEVGNPAIQTHWANFYAGPMQDFQEVMEKGEATDRPNTVAMGLLMKVWTAQVMTDLWGDIGYSEALRGRDPAVGLTVNYDTQEQVYARLLAEAQDVAEMAVVGGLTIGNADIIYRGNMTRWIRFANSLRMRMAMRLSDVQPAVAQAAFAAAYNAGGFQSNDDHAVLWYLDNGFNRHPIHVYELGRNDHSVSGTMIDTLTSLNDPRLPVYAKPNADGEYWGAPNATLADPQLAEVSRIGAFYSRANAPGILMSYAELLFLQAEAAERNWITADAATLYAAGIRAAMEFNGIAAAAIDDYLGQAVIAYAGGADGLRQIALQKWIALFGNGPEAFAEWRRTGVPELAIGPDALNDGRIPVRLFYPASEESLNRTALEAAQARQGGATLNSPVWWHVQN